MSSHIVVPRLYEGDHANLLQNDDRRIVFVLPFERDYSLVGTTELPFSGDLAEAHYFFDLDVVDHSRGARRRYRSSAAS